MKTYFKVIRKQFGLLQSAHVRDWTKNNHFNTIYSKNDWTYPKIENTRLFIFKTLEDARTYINQHFNPYFEIWECECIGVGNLSGVISPSNVDKFWSYKSKHKNTSQFEKINVSGALSAKAVKLLKKVN